MITSLNNFSHPNDSYNFFGLFLGIILLTIVVFLFFYYIAFI